MKKLLLLAALGGGAFAFTRRRKAAAEAEAKLWEEATGTPAGPKPATA